MIFQNAGAVDPSRRSPKVSGRFRRAHGVAVALGLALALAAPSLCSAQTLSLGSAGGFGLFGAYNADTGSSATLIGGPVNIIGNVGLDAGSSLSGTTSISGALYMNSDPTSYTGSGTPGGGTFTGAGVDTSLSQASQTAINAATTAASWTGSSGANQLTVSNNSVTLSAANSGQNVVTVNASNNAGLLNLNNTTLTINGSANEQVVFNFTGPRTTTWTNVNIVLQGIGANNVFFNFIGGNVGIVGGKINGNLLDVVNGTSMSLDGGVLINGSVISDGFVNMGNAVITPELPTILMAGLAGLLVVVPAGFRRLRRRRAIPSALSNA